MAGPNLLQFNWTDQGNAEALAHVFGKNIRYCTDSDVWFSWNGHIWESTHQGEIRQLAIRTAQRLRQAWQDSDRDPEVKEKALKYYRGGENRGRAVSTASTAADLPRLRIRYVQFDTDVWKLGVRNGEIDLQTGKFWPPRQESFLTKSAGVHFDPQADCPRFKQFIQEIFCGDTDLIEVVQRIFGYCLTGSTEEQVMFMCIGGGANGKSTLFNVIRRVMGDYAKLTPSSTFNAASRSEQTNDLASLAGARFVTISESDEDSFLAEAKLKAATGSDPITCRFLNKEFFSYIPQFKILMSANQTPGMRGINNGNFRRPVLIHFNATFEGAKRVNGLEDILALEGSGILNWMLEGLARWREHKLSSGLPKVLEDARQAYKKEQDFLGQWLDECVEMTGKDGDEILGKDLFLSYSEYARSWNNKPKGRKTWSQEMKLKGFEPVKASTMKYKGMRLVEQQDEFPRGMVIKEVVKA